MKLEIEPIDATPEKRLFLSIINDYELKNSLCELIDNAIDTWAIYGKVKPLLVDITLDVERQTIAITDNAGGVRREDLRLLISPGGSKNDPEMQSIGIFGVGSKRAVVALAEHISIKTHHEDNKTYQVDISNDWLASHEWEMPAYEIDDGPIGVTSIVMSLLRRPMTDDDVESLRIHLGKIYSNFIRRGIAISVNGEPIFPVRFDVWAFPPKNEPRSISFEVTVEDALILVEITCGLILDRDPESENYGVYFYCNERGIANEVKTRDVGYYISGEAGVPHPDASLCRAIVEITGPAKLMPWNSSKSAINFNHPVFLALRPTLLRLISHFSSLSRRLKNDWQANVFSYTSGDLIVEELEDATQSRRVHLPPLPKVNKARHDKVKAKNKTTIDKLPWTLGLLEAISAVDVIERQHLDTGQRIALLLLDSNFEIALKEFIVHNTQLFPLKIYNDEKIADLFKQRHKVIAEVRSKISIDQNLIDRANHYYSLRNKLIHERATATVTKNDVTNYRAVVEKILNLLFGLDFDC